MKTLNKKEPTKILTKKEITLEKMKKISGGSARRPSYGNRSNYILIVPR